MFLITEETKETILNSQLNKLRSEIKIGTETTLKISWNVVGYSNDEITFPHMSPHKLD